MGIVTGYAKYVIHIGILSKLTVAVPLAVKFMRIPPVLNGEAVAVK